MAAGRVDDSRVAAAFTIILQCRDSGELPFNGPDAAVAPNLLHSDRPYATRCQASGGRDKKNLLPISVPYAPLLYKILLGIPLLIFCVLALRWGGKNLGNCVRMLQGQMPLPKGSSWPFVIVGVVFYAGVLAVGAFFSLFSIAMQTTSPTIVSENGIVPGAGPPFYRHKFIAWRDVTKVTCNLPPRENRVRIITIYSHNSGLQMGNAGVALEGVLNAVKAKAPKGTVRPCEHGALDHFWSY